MKKILFVAALALGSMTAIAQETEAPQNDATQETSAQETTQEGFTAIESSELPEAITSAVSQNYPTATIDQASVNESEQYKLEVSLEDGTKGVLYADKDGNWIDM
ncbi:MAG: hypothetical protein V7724_09250 [Sediminicola sp.]|tara:strand:- start:100092 stop:100406 length:315 start_codon:yes stop_codon:yes gene_type:complete